MAVGFVSQLSRVLSLQLVTTTISAMASTATAISVFTFGLLRLRLVECLRRLLLRAYRAVRSGCLLRRFQYGCGSWLVPVSVKFVVAVSKS